MALVFLSFLLGLAIGSFLNVIILRLETGETILGRSHCPHCKHQLTWLDLIPVFSFLWLRGKCRYCGERISWQYPIVEISTGVVFLLIFNYQLSSINQLSIINLLFLFFVASSLLVIFIYDLRHYLIPDAVLFPAIAVAFLYRFFDFAPRNVIGQWESVFFWISPHFLNYVLAACVASGFFLIIHLVSRGRWIGFGDVKLAVLLGLLLGFPNIILGLFLSFWIGAVISLVLILTQKRGLKYEVPFAPFLIMGTFVALFWGDRIMHWYFALLLP